MCCRAESDGRVLPARMVRPKRNTTSPHNQANKYIHMPNYVIIYTPMMDGRNSQSTQWKSELKLNFHSFCSTTLLVALIQSDRRRISGRTQ